MNIIKRKHIYILVIFFIILFSITNSHIELEHRENILLENQKNIEDLEEYNEIDVLYQLEIKNYQNDNTIRNYKYKIKIKNISGAYKYRYKDKESYLVFTANGESQFNLESNESIIIYDLPENAEYEIEQTTNVSKQYTTKVDGEYTTKILGNVNGITEVAFDNETISKTNESIKPQNNPYTKDNYYLILIATSFALVLSFIGKNFKIRRFE